ncbi:MAG: type I methionyl aminopeptidase [Gemmatimonadetes bacterium]|nr:type I methionyl aminopeptidase [Gemmatimonadota bacterium]MYE17044.1 type I methionyl aminopeptidase [Gemmatimonadota bacterium]
MAARKRAAAIHLKSRAEIDAIARGGAIISALFAELEPRVHPGVTTAALDRFADTYIRSHDGAVPAFKGLYGFPGSACISVNAEVVHGIPRTRRLCQGDIVSIDVGVRQGGWCADSAYTFPVGEIGDDAAHILAVTRDALRLAVAAARPGHHVGDIGAAVVNRVRGTGLAIIRDLVGHGVGRQIHEEPQVPNRGRAGRGVRLHTGMVLAIEPMLSAGTEEIVTLADRWTVTTADGRLSAHFEHTVAVTADGPAILTGGGIWDRPGPPNRGGQQPASGVGTRLTTTARNR